MSRERQAAQPPLVKRISMGRERLLDVNEAAERLSVSSWTVRDLVRSGELTHVRIGRLIKIPESSIAKLVGAGLSVGTQA